MDSLCGWKDQRTEKKGSPLKNFSWSIILPSASSTICCHHGALMIACTATSWLPFIMVVSLNLVLMMSHLLRVSHRGKQNELHPSFRGDWNKSGPRSSKANRSSMVRKLPAFSGWRKGRLHPSGRERRWSSLQSGRIRCLWTQHRNCCATDNPRTCHNDYNHWNAVYSSNNYRRARDRE